MSNKFKHISIKSHTYCFFDVVNIKDFGPNILK